MEYSDELVGKAVRWFYEKNDYIDIGASSSGDNELNEIVELYLEEKSKEKAKEDLSKAIVEIENSMAKVLKPIVENMRKILERETIKEELKIKETKFKKKLCNHIKPDRELREFKITTLDDRMNGIKERWFVIVCVHGVVVSEIEHIERY